MTHQPQPLIGADLMPAYIAVLRIAMAGAVGAVLATGVIASILAGGAPGPVADGFVGAIKAAFVTFGATTIVFALAQRHPGSRQELRRVLPRLGGLR